MARASWKKVRVKGASKSLESVKAVKVGRLLHVPGPLRGRGVVWLNRADRVLFVETDGGRVVEEPLPCYLFSIVETSGVFVMGREEFEEHFELVGGGS